MLFDLNMYLAEEWVNLFKKKPKTTIIGTVIIVISVGVGINLLNQADKKRSEADRLKNLNYKTQIQQLNVTESNIKELLEFIEIQKDNLKNTEDIISSMQKEQEELKPIVETNRATIEAIFRKQDERNRPYIWRERWIGFGFGIAASLIASIIFYVINILLKPKRLEK